LLIGQLVKAALGDDNKGKGKGKWELGNKLEAGNSAGNALFSFSFDPQHLLFFLQGRAPSGCRQQWRW